MNIIKITREDIIIEFKSSRWSFDYLIMSVNGMPWTLNVPFRWKFKLKDIDKHIEPLENLINKIVKREQEKSQNL